MPVGNSYKTDTIFLSDFQSTIFQQIVFNYKNVAAIILFRENYVKSYLLFELLFLCVMHDILAAYT